MGPAEVVAVSVEEQFQLSQVPRSVSTHVATTGHGTDEPTSAQHQVF